MQPTLTTFRLLLRPFALTDAKRVQQLAGTREVAATTLNLPHPYEDGVAEAWIATHQGNFDQGTAVSFAIVRRSDDSLIGAISLQLKPDHARAVLGYWVGVPYWNQGYCTEAGQAILAYGFEQLRLNKIHATHFRGNRASGRVMQKLGMSHEGTRRQHIRKWGEFLDLEENAILRSDFVRTGKQAS